MQYRLLFIIIMLVFSFRYGQAQGVKPKSASTAGAVFNFRFDSAVLDSGYMHNAISLKELDRILSDTSTISTIDSIRITAASSIDGNIDHNRALALHRAKAIKGYILWKYPRINAKIIITCVIGENWDGLRQCIEQDNNVPFRTKVWEIIDQGVNLETKEWRLRQVGSGAAWKYVTSNFLKHLRVGSAQIDICRQEVCATVQEQIIEPDTLITPTTEKPIIIESNAPTKYTDSLTQTETPIEKIKKEHTYSRWYVGVGGGISFGRGTFCSFAMDDTRPGFNVGVLGGYKINKLLSAELSLDYMRMTLSAYDCCQLLWLSSDGNRYAAPVAGMSNYQYNDLHSTTNLFGLGAHLNIDLVSIWNDNSHWSAFVSPAIYGVYSSANIKQLSTGKSATDANSFHFGVGADLGVDCQIIPCMGLRLTTGVNYMQGKGIDGLPREEHKTNYVWNTSLKLIFKL